MFKGNKLDLIGRWSYYNLTFVCATYRSLYLLSCVALVTLCDVLFFTSALWNASSLVDKSYLLQLNKTLIFANAGNCTLLILLVLHQGLNVRWLIHLVHHKYALVGVCWCYITGLVVKINAILFSSICNVHYLLCLRSFTFYRLPRIFHSRYIHLVATLGSIGVGCVVVCWIQ